MALQDALIDCYYNLVIRTELVMFFKVVSEDHLRLTACRLTIADLSHIRPWPMTTFVA